MIEAVLFDIDGTLLDHERASLASLHAALEHERPGIGVAERHAATLEWRRLEEHHYGCYLRGEIDLAEQRRRRAGGVLRWLGSPLRPAAELDAWFAAFLEGYRRHWSLFDDVEPAIAALERAGLRLGAITNADAAQQRRKLAALGLGHRLPVFVASSAVGVAKPDPEIFRIAARLLSLPVERIAYVGDRPRTDAGGARDAGMLGIWLNRDGHPPRSAAGVPAISSLIELQSLIEGSATAVGRGA
jgi:putative hydrolase of the HAD superfamily